MVVLMIRYRYIVMDRSSCTSCCSPLTVPLSWKPSCISTTSAHPYTISSFDHMCWSAYECLRTESLRETAARAARLTQIKRGLYPSPYPSRFGERRRPSQMLQRACEVQFLTIDDSNLVCNTLNTDADLGQVVDQSIPACFGLLWTTSCYLLLPFISIATCVIYLSTQGDIVLYALSCLALSCSSNSRILSATCATYTVSAKVVTGPAPKQKATRQ
ncbi:hypothetical protein KCU76_g31, partial [Aureobasidium melanogenum]